MRLDDRMLLAATPQFPAIALPPGFQIERVVGGLTYPTSIAWDDQGRMYVAEAGGQFLEEPPPPRILRVEGGQATEAVNLADRGVADSVAGMTFHRGGFYITHREPADRTGAVSRVELDGTVTRLLTGVIDAQSEHNLDEVRVGPDGRMYVTSGGAFNSAVAGTDNAPFVRRSPGVHTTAGRDIVLTGENFETPDFRTPDPTDKVQTGAFVPFGTATTPGQVIRGTNKPGQAILVFDPDNAEATVRPFAWGLRHAIGLGWGPGGELYSSVNSYDVRGSRPVKDEFEATYRIREGAWYGWPDYSAALEPLTDPKFDVPDSLQAPVSIDGVPQGRRLGFLIDHAASGLGPPDRSLILGLHEYQSSPTKLDVAPASWGELAGQVFVTEWGDLSPETNPLQDRMPGYRVSRIDPATGRVEPFVRNALPGPASRLGVPGLGIERPFDVKFGPDGAMYIVDYGVARVNEDRRTQNQVPYEFPPLTGAIWKVTRIPGVPLDLAGPRVVEVSRSGFRRDPTRITLTFSEDLDPSRAQDLGNYRLIAPGRDGRFRSQDDRAIGLRSAVYDPAARTVTLSADRRLGPQRLRIVVDGTGPRGATDRAGNLLDGDRDGQSGGEFATTFVRRFRPKPAARDAGPGLTGRARLGLPGQPQQDHGIGPRREQRPSSIGSLSAPSVDTLLASMTLPGRPRLRRAPRI